MSNYEMRYAVKKERERLKVKIRALEEKFVVLNDLYRETVNVDEREILHEKIERCRLMRDAAYAELNDMDGPILQGVSNEKPNVYMCPEPVDIYYYEDIIRRDGCLRGIKF